MRYRVTQNQITDNLNMIDKSFESRFESGQPFSGVDKFNIGNGLKQIEQDTESLCSYIDTLNKTITDLGFQISDKDQMIKMLNEQIKKYETSLGIISNLE